MAQCSNCTAQLQPAARFCDACGKPAAIANPPQGANVSYFAPSSQQNSPNMQAHGGIQGTHPHHLAARGFSQIFGLHPAAALLTVIVNVMIFGSAGVAAMLSLATVGTSLVALTIVSTISGAILGFITYKMQRKWYEDDKESAVIKALIVGFLTAIPAGLPGFLVIPSGIIGFFRKKT